MAFKRRWGIQLVSDNLTELHENSIKKGLKIIINKIENVYYIVFKDKNGQLARINIENKLSLGPIKSCSLEEFFIGEDVNDNFYPNLGEYIVKKINSRGDYKSPWDSAVGYLEKDLFHLTFSHYKAAERLYKEFLTFFSGGFLLHLSLECFLKACILFEKNEFPSDHSLDKLVKQTSFKLNNGKIDFIRELDKRHYLRYRYDEAGTDDLTKWQVIVKSIRDQMPSDLLKILEDVESNHPLINH